MRISRHYFRTNWHIHFAELLYCALNDEPRPSVVEGVSAEDGSNRNEGNRHSETWTVVERRRTDKGWTNDDGAKGYNRSAELFFRPTLAFLCRKYA